MGKCMSTAPDHIHIPNTESQFIPHQHDVKYIAGAYYQQINKHTISKHEYRAKMKKQCHKKHQNGCAGYDISAVNISCPRAFHKDRYAWTVNTNVSIRVIDHRQWTLGIIQEIHDTELITVQYDTINGQIAQQTVNRFDVRMVKSDKEFITNRSKLTLFCIVELFNDNKHQWESAYIKETFANGNDFIISGEKFGRWNKDIRCSKALLNLTINSTVYVFNCNTMIWCDGVIVDIIKPSNNNNRQLDIFKIIYGTDGEYHYKCIHQFSALIVPKHDGQIPIDVMSPEQDTTDAKYGKLLLQGWLRTSNIQHIYDDIATLLVCYISSCHGLVMYLESKYWIHAATTTISTTSNLKCCQQITMRNMQKHDGMDSKQLLIDNNNNNEDGKDNLLISKSSDITGSGVFGHSQLFDYNNSRNNIMYNLEFVPKTNTNNDVSQHLTNIIDDDMDHEEDGMDKEEEEKEEDEKTDSKQTADNLLIPTLSDITSQSISDSISSNISSSSSMHPIEAKLRQKLEEKGAFTQENFERAQYLASQRRSGYVPMVREESDDDIDYEDQMIAYNKLPSCIGRGIGENESNDKYDDNNDESFSLESGDPLHSMSNHE